MTPTSQAPGRHEEAVEAGARAGEAAVAGAPTRVATRRIGPGGASAGGGGAEVCCPEHDPALSPAMQRYLLAIAAAQRGEGVTATALAQALGYAIPTCLEMLRRLEHRGVLVGGDRRTGWRLTAEGHREVAAMRRRQAVLERFLRMTLHIDAVEAQREAVRIAPLVSRSLEARLRDAVFPPRRPCRGPAPMLTTEA